MKIKLIAQGSLKLQRYIRYWGLSFLVGDDILFDAFGSPLAFSMNMRSFGIEAQGIRHIVISHDDWDHISGLWRILKKNKRAKVYVCPHSNRDFKEKITASGAELMELSGPILIREGVHSTGEIRGVSGARVIHEQALVVEGERGLAVVCGCAHPGIADIVSFVKKNFNDKVDTVIGGFHLKDKTAEEMTGTIESLLHEGVSKVVPLHCTGESASRLMRKTFSESCILLKEGDFIEV